jgi:hypothetical protein
MELFLFYVWCASVAGDTKNYITAAKNKDEVLNQIPYWYRQDWEIRFATLDESLDIGGAIYDGEDRVVFENKFFEYNTNRNRFEYDCDVNYTIRPELYR